MYTGLEEDFKAWKEDFKKTVFPVLLGEVAMDQLTAVGGDCQKSSCDCGKRENHGGKAEGGGSQVMLMDTHTHFAMVTSSLLFAAVWRAAADREL